MSAFDRRVLEPRPTGRDIDPRIDVAITTAISGFMSLAAKTGPARSADAGSRDHHVGPPDVTVNAGQVKDDPPKGNQRIQRMH